MRWYHLLISLLLLSICIIFYLSWIPEPQLGKVWFIPSFIARWADEKNNDSIRTAVPFVFLGILTGIYLAYRKGHWYGWLVSAVVLITIACIAEAGQFFLPHRSFDVADILWGSAGGIAGELLIAVVWLAARRIKSPSR